VSGQRGSILLDHQTWRLKLRRRDASGRQRWGWVRLGTRDELPTRAAARRAADRYLERLDPRELKGGSEMSWDAWCDRYLERWLFRHATGTRATQASIIEKHLRSAFSGPVHAIDRTDVQDFVLAQYKAGAAASTIAARFAVLRRMLRQAAEDGIAVQPPTSAQAALPKDEQMHTIVRLKAFTESECELIFDLAEIRDATAYMLARYAGLRASELLGLTWPLVNLETGAITVRQQALDGEVRPLKTKGSAAVMQAPANLIEQLRFYRGEWEGAGRAVRGEFLFPDAKGRPETAQALRERLHLLLAKEGIRRRGLHGFRHACALAMADEGCNPEVIRRAMRHSSLRVTAIYLSAAPEDIAAALARGAKGPTISTVETKR
jgi:integrase